MDTILNFPFGLGNASAVCQKAIQRDYALQFGYGMLSPSELDMIQSKKGKIAPLGFPFGLRKSSVVY